MYVLPQTTKNICRSSVEGFWLRTYIHSYIRVCIVKFPIALSQLLKPLFLLSLPIYKDTENLFSSKSDHILYVYVSKNNVIQQNPYRMKSSTPYDNIFDKLYRHFPFPDPPKYTQKGILDKQIYQLATLSTHMFFLRIALAFA
jgi:hypothetical protein